ncbi:MAG: hypothetical protein GKR98_06175 [Boseongicola sp.]|nr:MAG: hypothetical protein GKR98_06175 [Boseongicola sp.]
MIGPFPSFMLMVAAVLIIVPFWRLLPGYGVSKYFALLAPIPAVALALLWVMAFRDSFKGTGG